METVIAVSSHEKRLKELEEKLERLEQNDDEEFLRSVDERGASLEQVQRLAERTIAFSVNDDTAIQLVQDFHNEREMWCASFPLPEDVDEVVKARYWSSKGEGEWKLLSPSRWKLEESHFVYGVAAGVVQEDRLSLYRKRLRITVRQDQR